MKKFRLAGLLAACILLSAGLTGCTAGQDNAESSLPESSMPPVIDGEPISSMPEVISSGPVSSMPEPAGSTPATAGEEVATIVTSDKEFNKLFEANPIDAAYKKDMADATSTTEMLAVAEKYAKIWQDEIASGFQKLMDSTATDAEKESFQSKHTSWEEDTPAALDKISSSAAGGSLAKVDIAGQVMEHYRSRAAAIYKNLYAYDKEFTYHTQF